MTCQVEMMNGNGTLDRESSPENESDIEIMTLKETLKEKLFNENLNGIVNGKHEEACSSSNSLNTNGTFENGHGDEKTITDSEFELDIIEKQPSKRNRGKFAKGKREKIIATPKSKRHVKKTVNSVVDEESVVSEKMEIIQNHEEDDTSTIDVGDNEDISVIIEESESSVQLDTSVGMNSLDEKTKEVEERSSYFSRLRDRMRFSISPQKVDVAASSSYIPQISEKESTSFRVVSGRRALHQSPPTYNFNDYEPVAQKRKAESESIDEPQVKRFIPNSTSGWTFFSSPFSRFWSPKKSAAGNATVSSSTPLRKLHEDMEDSMTVNVDESFNNLLDEDQEIDNAKPVMQAKQPSTPNPASWKCSIM